MKGHVYRRRLANGSWSRWHAVIDERVPPGHRRRQTTTTHNTRAQAEQWLAERVVRTKDRAGGPTVGEFLTQWLTTRESLRASTRRSYEGHIRIHLEPHLGHIVLADLTAGDIARANAALRNGGLSLATLARVHATLSASLNSAVRQSLIPANPAERVELPSGQRTESRTWTAAEVGRFLTHVQGDPWHAAFRLLLVCGFRRGEVLGLRWKDLELRPGLVHVRQQVVAVGGDVVVNPPKSRRGTRTVAIDPDTSAALREHRVRAVQFPAGSAFVFPAANGGPCRPSVLSRHFAHLAAQADLPAIRLHDLRHTSASLGLAAGESLLEVSRRLGHSSVAITGDVYSHLDVDAARDRASRLAALYRPASGVATESCAAGEVR